MAGRPCLRRNDFAVLCGGNSVRPRSRGAPSSHFVGLRRARRWEPLPRARPAAVTERRNKRCVLWHPFSALGSGFWGAALPRSGCGSLACFPVSTPVSLPGGWAFEPPSVWSRRWNGCVCVRWRWNGCDCLCGQASPSSGLKWRQHLPEFSSVRRATLGGQLGGISRKTPGG